MYPSLLVEAQDLSDNGHGLFYLFCLDDEVGPESDTAGPAAQNEEFMGEGLLDKAISTLLIGEVEGAHQPTSSGVSYQMREVVADIR